MNKELAVLNDQETSFIEHLLDNGGNLYRAAEAAGYAPGNAYKLRTRLAQHIIKAAHEHLAVNSIKAAIKLVDTVDAEVPNPIHLSAAQALLDRVGIIKKDPTVENTPVIKANIFILPEKRYSEEVLEVEGKYNTGLLAIPFKQ